VDKTRYVYSIKGLHAAGCAGKALYPGWTERGQKRFSEKKTGFCTFAAVDMQAFFHRSRILQAILLPELVCSACILLVGRMLSSFLRQSRPCHFLPEDRKTVEQWSALLSLRLAEAIAGRLSRLPFSTRSRFLVLVNLNRYINW
jgi:hypothetical protein